MSKILISYRRDDSPDATGRIYDRLTNQFGKEVVFKDVNSIPLGVDFRTYLDEQVSNCSIFLAVIGREWIKKRGSKDLRENNLTNIAPRFWSDLDGTIEKRPRPSTALVRVFRLRPVQRWPEDWMRD